MVGESLVMDSSRVLEIILQALRELVEYELAVILKYDGQEHLRVIKALGPLSTRALNNYTISLDERPDLAAVITRKRAHLFSPDEPHVDTYADILDLPDQHSCLVSPLMIEDELVGLLTLDHRSCNRFSPAIVRFVETLSKLMSIALIQLDMSRDLAEQNSRLLQERNQLLLSESDVFSHLVGESTEWQRVLDSVKLVASATVPVLLQGETGTGKEEIARAIHRLSPRARGPFVPLNCSALTASLAESELFGHEKGAFTGALALKRGRFELAHGGTLFLDEIGDLPLELQPKLLRALQEGVFERVGGEKPVQVDVRIIAATHVDLQQAVAAGTFREDLYYRLAVFPIELPPLQLRSADILLLADYFLRRIRERSNRQVLSFSPEALDKIQRYTWPGNVRELKNVIERASILAVDGIIRPEHITGLRTEALEPASRCEEAGSHDGEGSDGRKRSLNEAMADHIRQALKACGGKIYGSDGAAALLGLKPSTLQSRMKKLGIRK
ncbi:sigma 54-interacting transcriptional regulator [Gracilinema caldarium]|uniref:Transcriptional regulator, NifA subfamily, Fis Family n=1 Tax=Gracilinema caldarium (strain ATCC 51460 / DSM 7334 / H1) TaxID=744872 RepID=F8EXC0_GRAC1|nr:sigma 54-interacting transcriptional regulator [Gracilinema caldarium]AEJ18863.1 transcriptional regulator, NifA subfamily, Fis Family [Gracilinema caldarium DSM 7334]